MTVRSEAGANSPKLGHIEVFRGVAVSLVLLYHLSAPGFAFAYVGVDSFFVISGFLMALLYGEMDDRTAAGDFYRRRLARLLPAYFCILVASIIAAAAIVLPNEFADAVRYAKWSAALAPNVGFWMDASYFDSAYFRPMLNFWSLGVELQFYLVFPLIVLLHRRKPSLALLVAIGSLVLFLLLSDVSPKTAFFQAPARIWEFMAGFYVTKLRLPNLPVGMGEAALLALVALIVAPSALRVDAMVLPLLTTALSALFIASGLTPGMETVALARLLKLLGKYSYSIYLVHFPVIVFLAYKPFGATSLALDGPSEYAAAILLTGVLSFTLFHLVEKPLRTCRTRRFVVGTVVAGAVVSSATAAMAAPLNSAGLPPRELLAVSAWFDRLPYRCPKLDRILHPFEQSCLIAGDHGPGWLLVGDSHADVMKAVLGEEVKRVGGRLRLMVPNAAIGRGLTPHEVLDEARAWNLDHIVIHSTTAHMNVEAIQALAAKAAREQIVVAVIAPVPSPGYNVPKRILTSLEDGRTPEPERSLASYSARHKRLLDELGEIPGTRVFRPAEFLCRPLCAIENNVGVPLYSDGGHLSQTGVEALRPMLRRMVSVG